MERHVFPQQVVFVYRAYIYFVCELDVGVLDAICATCRWILNLDSCFNCELKLLNCSFSDPFRIYLLCARLFYTVDSRTTVLSAMCSLPKS